MSPPRRGRIAAAFTVALSVALSFPLGVALSFPLGVALAPASAAFAEGRQGRHPFGRPSVLVGAGRVLPTDGIGGAGMTWGAGLGVDYEWDRARIGGAFFLGGGGSWSNSTLGISADWLPLPGTWTPYLGGGGGFALIGKKRRWESTGEQLVPPYLNLLPMISMEGGVELFRDRATRLLIGAEVELPWSRPYECNADLTSCGVVWRLRYPVVALKTRLLF